MGNYISTTEPLPDDSSTPPVEVKPDNVDVPAKPTSEEVTAIVENINQDNELEVATDATRTCSPSCKCGPNCSCSPCTCAADGM